MEIIKSLMQKELLGTHLYIYIYALGIFLFTGILGKLISSYINKKLLKFFDKKNSLFGKKILKVVSRPIIFLLYIIVFKLVSDFFAFSMEVKKYISQIFFIIISVYLGYVSMKLIDLLALYLQPKVEATKSKIDDQLLPIGKKFAKIFVFIILAMLILDNLGYNITSLIAGLGIGGLAVALAAQDTLKNLFGSLTLFMDKPFQLGERIQVDTYDGIIDRVGLRSTRLKTLDGTMVTIPNGKMADSAIDNITKRPAIKNLYEIGITYDTSYDKTKEALKIIRTVLKKHPSTDNYWVYFKSFGDFSLKILVIHWCKYTAYEQFLIATEEINLEIKKQFEESGINFAFPTQTVHFGK